MFRFRESGRRSKLMVEVLEPRTLLSGTVQVQVGSTLQMKEFQSSSPIAMAPHGSVVIDVNVKPVGTSQPIPTGQVQINWYDQGIDTGEVTATLVPNGKGAAFTSATIYVDQLSEIPVVDAGAGISINAVYLGDSNYKKTNSATTNDPSYPWTQGGSYVPVNFTDFKLAFVSPPRDTGLGLGSAVVFNPGVEIAEETASGDIYGSGFGLMGTLVVTNSKGQQTSLSTGTLPYQTNYTTIFYQSLPLTIGKYRMAFYSNDGLSVTSQQFRITQNHLVINNQPSQVGVGSPIAFSVSLEDPSGSVIASDSTDIVQITASPDQGTGAIPLQGTTTLKLTNGVATFSAGVDFSSDTTGYTDITATEVDPSLQPISTTAKVTSKAIFVGGYQLVMVKQLGEDINPLGPNQVIYDIEDLNNKPVSIFDHSRKFEVFADLYVSHLGVSFVVKEFPLPPPKNGGRISFNLVTDFTGDIAYYFLRTRIVASEGTATPPIEASGDSNTFFIVAYQSVVTEPATLNAGQPGRYSMQIEDVNNRPVSMFDHSVRVQLPGTYDEDKQSFPIAAVPVRSPKHGLIVFPLIEYTPTDYQFFPNFIQSNGTPSAFIDEKGFGAIIVTADHFAFAKQPLTADAGVKVRGQVILQDSADNRAPYFDGGRKIRVSVYATLEGSNTPVLVASNLVLRHGIANFTYKLGVGTYALSAQAQGINGTSPSAVDPAVSDPFTITGYHMVFLTQPKDVTSKKSGRVIVALEDINGKISSIFDHTPALGIDAQIESATSQIFDLAQNLKLHGGRTAFRYFQSIAGTYQLAVIVNGNAPIDNVQSDTFTVFN
jgi:hypothetical protein